MNRYEGIFISQNVLPIARLKEELELVSPIILLCPARLLATIYHLSMLVNRESLPGSLHGHLVNSRQFGC